MHVPVEHEMAPWHELGPVQQIALVPAVLVTMPQDDMPEHTTSQLDPPQATWMPHEPWPEQSMAHLEAFVQSTLAHDPMPQLTEHGMFEGQVTDAQLLAAVQSITQPPSTHVPPAAMHGAAQLFVMPMSTPASCGIVASELESGAPESPPVDESPVQASTTVNAQAPRIPELYQGLRRLSMRGKGMVSRTCCKPQIHATVRSMPRPNPAWGKLP